MSLPKPDELLGAMSATWPPERRFRHGPWTLRQAPGGGSRVTSAIAEGPVGPEDIAAAERKMEALGQPAIFMVRDGEDELDGMLGAQGYSVLDPVVMLAAPVDALSLKPLPPVSAYPHWPPLAIAEEIWRDGDMTPPRRAIIDRAPEPKTAVMARTDDRAAGILFAALHGAIAVVHAVHTLPDLRRRGSARNMMVGAARWAEARGAGTVALAVTRANAPALALYGALGMTEAAGYHYRRKEDAR